MTKYCKWCKTTKPVENFHRGAGKHGRQSRCKECIKAYHGELRAADPEKWNDNIRRNNIWKSYKISVEEYDTIMKDGICFICKSDNHVGLDHCHQTGKLRKPLCSRCNVAVGMVDDDPQLLRQLASYLEDHGQA